MTVFSLDRSRLGSFGHDDSASGRGRRSAFLHYYGMSGRRRTGAVMSAVVMVFTAAKEEYGNAGNGIENGFHGNFPWLIFYLALSQQMVDF